MYQLLKSDPKIQIPDNCHSYFNTHIYKYNNNTLTFVARNNELPHSKNFLQAQVTE